MVKLHLGLKDLLQTEALRTYGIQTFETIECDSETVVCTDMAESMIILIYLILLLIPSSRMLAYPNSCAASGGCQFWHLGFRIAELAERFF